MEYHRAFGLDYFLAHDIRQVIELQVPENIILDLAVDDFRLAPLLLAF
jgi:hypothetical protein